MAQSAILITAGDAHVFDLLRGTILSIREKSTSPKPALGFFDLGCSPEQLEWVQGQVDQIRQPEWDYRFPGRDQVPGYFKGLLARPFLRRYFPGFEVYFWID